MVGAEWTIPYSTPPGRHSIIVRWLWPEKTKQTLTAIRYVTVENPHFGKTEDFEISRLRKRFGEEKVVVLQDGREIAGRVYDGTQDLALTWGGSEGQQTARTEPGSRVFAIGNLTVNRRSAYYARGLLRFDLEPLRGKKVKKAWLRMTIRPNQPYRPGELKQSMEIYPMLKPWKEGIGTVYVDRRGMGKGFPSYLYQAFPVKWESPLASGDSDNGKVTAKLIADDAENVLPSAKADVTELVNLWIDDKLANHGVVIGSPLPSAIVTIHPRDAVKEYAELYNGSLVPFFSSDERDDIAFRPRLVVVLE